LNTSAIISQAIIATPVLAAQTRRKEFEPQRAQRAQRRIRNEGFLTEGNQGNKDFAEPE